MTTKFTLPPIFWKIPTTSYCRYDENRCCWKREPQPISLHMMLHHTLMTWFALTFAVHQNADSTAQPSITIEDDDGPTPNEEIQTDNRGQTRPAETIKHQARRLGGVGGFGRTPPPVQASSACPIGKLVPPAQLGPACRSWFRFFPLLSAYHELFFANELINYFTCMTLYK